MSVFKCGREGCTNIMCDKYSYTYGYICNECFEELVELTPYITISGFMESKKGETQANNRKRDSMRVLLTEEFKVI